MVLKTWGALLVALVLMLTIAEGAEIVVGGTKGWTTGFNYDTWVASLNSQIRVGDTLVFHNPDAITHTVGLVANDDSYQRCVLGGATNIVPVAPGANITMPIPAALEGQTLYAVCTIAGHCSEMQKIRVTVGAASVNSTASTGPAMAPAPVTSDASDADLNRYICWTTAIVLIVAGFWNSG